MKSILFFLLVVTSSAVFACSCAPHHSFCESRFVSNYDIMVRGTIVDTNSLFIRLAIDEVLEGLELEDTMGIRARAGDLPIESDK